MFESLSKNDAQINYTIGFICEGTANNGSVATRLCWLSKMPKKFDVNDEFHIVHDDVLLTQGGGPIDLSPRYTPSGFRCVAYVLYFITIYYGE
jgi:hypothetical protein